MTTGRSTPAVLTDTEPLVPATAEPLTPRSRAGRLRGLVKGAQSAGYVDLMLAQMVPLGVSFLLTLVSASLLGPERRGVLTFLMTAALLFGALAYGSLHVPVVAGLRSGNRADLRHGIGVVVGLWAALSLIGLALVVSVRLTEGAWSLSTPSEVGWGLVGGGLVVAQLFAGRVLQGLARNRDYQVVVNAQSVLYLVGSGAVLVSLRSPVLMFAAWYCSVVVSVVLAVFYLRRQLVDRPSAAGPPSTFGTFLRSAMANNVGSIGQMVMLRVDVLVVTLIVGPAAAGVYGIALSLTELALIAPEVLALSVFANRARMAHDRWTVHLRQTLRLAAAATTVAMVCIAAVAVVLAGGFLSSYTGLVPLVLVILPGTLFAGYSRVALGALQALNAPATVWRFGVLALIMAAGYFPAAMIAGSTGTAVMSTVAYAVTALYLRRGLAAGLRGETP